MHQLFEVYHFDGWHIDTFGESSGFAFDGSPVNYIAGFKPYIDHASASLHKRVLLNAVNTWGQTAIANSAADFVYSELWEDHETFASILNSAEQVHLANPDKAYVIAAYLHRRENKDPDPPAKEFNPASVLLTDAAIFASGAAHIELGDGQRMLSNEYFPADTRLAVSPQLEEQLRHYYDYLTAYEVYLRDRFVPVPVQVSIPGHVVDPLGIPQTIWSISRRQGSLVTVHLINLLGSDDPHWRDISISRPSPPKLQRLSVRLSGLGRVRSVGWASPDVDGGQFHPLKFRQKASPTGYEVETALPTLFYWDTLFVELADGRPAYASSRFHH
jgi:dextranase